MLVLDGVRRGSGQPLNLASSASAAVAVLAPLPAVSPRKSLDGLRPKEEAASLVTRVADAFVPEPETRRRSHWYPLAATALLAPAFALTAHGALTIPRPSVAPVARTAAVAQPVPEPPKAPEVSAVQAQLQQLLNDFGAKETASFGIVIKNLATGDTAVLNPEKTYTSASLYKLFVAHQLYLGAEKGELAITPSDISCLRSMISVSSNDCGRALGDKVGWGRQDAALKAQGFTGTTLASLQKTSAQDIALLLERLYKKESLAPEHADLLLQFMKEQGIVNRLPQGLPPGTEIAHKTGDLFGYVHDSGIVYSPKGDYIIVSMSGPWSNPGQAPSRFAELSAKVYALINQ